MSRSFKKNPFLWIAGVARQETKKWKRKCNKKIRGAEVSNGSNFKKVTNSWNAPGDCKIFDNQAKSFRK